MLVVTKKKKKKAQTEAQNLSCNVLPRPSSIRRKMFYIFYIFFLKFFLAQGKSNAVVGKLYIVLYMRTI
jgi:hypothetical protein